MNTFTLLVDGKGVKLVVGKEVGLLQCRGGGDGLLRASVTDYCNK